MMEFRVKSKRGEEWMASQKGGQVSDEMVNIVLHGQARVFKPDGKLLCVYLPGAVKDLADEMYEDFSTIRITTRNRGLASGGKRVYHERRVRGEAPEVLSGLLGAVDMDRNGMKEPVCRLTSFTAQQVEKWDRLLPMFQRIAQRLAENVPDRYAAQMREAERSHPDWVIKDTPFTTITVNNTYPTGIHTDKGDLDAGFSTLACIRRGEYTGGWIGFPQYGVFADMQDGDLLLMDAHEWHGNTPILCTNCGEDLRKPDHRCAEDPPMPFTSPERISIVSYFRTGITACGSGEEEAEKRSRLHDERNMRILGLETAGGEQEILAGVEAAGTVPQ